MCKRPAEKEESKERRIPETKTRVSRRRERSTQLETKQRGPGQIETQSILLHWPFGGHG